MKKHINKLSTIQKAAAGIGGAVVVLASATDFFAGNYLVNYAIGRSGDGGNRTVSDDADAKLEEQKSADAETIINDAKKQMDFQPPFLKRLILQKILPFCQMTI